MEQQTAVEWLEEKFNNYDMSTGKAYFRKLLNEAKQMEKEQIQKAFSDGQETPLNHPTLPHYSSQEYYNDTYEKV